jgi:hypothetical protein
VKRRILPQDPALQVLEPLSRLGAQLLGEAVPEVGEGAQCLGRLPGAVVGEHQLADEPLVEGVGGDERDELRHEPVVVPQPQLGLDTGGERGQVLLPQVVALAADPRSGQAGEGLRGGRAGFRAPLRERLTEEPDGLVVVVGCQRLPGGVAPVLEAEQVDLLGGYRGPVAAVALLRQQLAGVEAGVAQRPADVGDDLVQPVPGRLGHDGVRIVHRPEQVDQ